jgi:type IV pilus assembly protein PilE
MTAWPDLGTLFAPYRHHHPSFQHTVTHSRYLKTRSAGFTLLEVMTAGVIVAVLAAIAMPSYSDYVRRGNIQDGTTVLSDGQVKMEQFFQDKLTYVGGPCPLPTKYFTYDCNNPPPTATTFLITAKGQVNVTGFDYTINQDAVRTSNTLWGIGPNCWITRKGDTC